MPVTPMQVVQSTARSTCLMLWTLPAGYKLFLGGLILVASIVGDFPFSARLRRRLAGGSQTVAPRQRGQR
jgi:hypothetical protein